MNLIDRNKLLDELQQMYSTLNRINVGNPSLLRELETVIETVENAPTIDAAPVVHGHWTQCGAKRACSVCKVKVCAWTVDCTLKYCPNCGARLEELKETNPYLGFPVTTLDQWDEVY